MKVLNLRCAHGHLFEGWFASEEDFLDQNGRNLIDCPLCADHVITRMPSAPRLNLSGAKDPEAPPPEPTAAEKQAALHARAADVQAMWMQAMKHMLAGTEDVGDRFPEEARRMHYGEVPDRAIRGAASKEEREALMEEGIEVIPLPLPFARKGPVQ
jgi:hypothetical protein